MAYLDNNGVLYLWGKIKAHVSSAVAGFYTKPSSGIPASDLAAGVIPDVSGKVDKIDGYGLVSASDVVNGYKLSISGDQSTDIQVVSITDFNVAMQQAMITLAGKADASALDNYALKSDISSMYKYSGSVATYSALPSSFEVAVGEVYNVESTGMNYAWDGAAWDALGETFSITAITNAEIDTICT